MQTYMKARPVEDNDTFEAQRSDALAALDLSAMDEPMVSLVESLNRLPHCFTLQCCFGHFVAAGDTDTRTLAPPPPMGKTPMEYRVAYVAICIRDDEHGRGLLDRIHELRDLDPKYIQVGSADWFWERQVNSYIIQVGPKRMRKHDAMTLDGKELRHVSHVRTQLWRRFAALVRRRRDMVEFPGGGDPG